MVVVIATQIVGLQVELGLRVVELGLVVVAVAVEAVLVVAILGCYPNNQYFRKNRSFG